MLVFILVTPRFPVQTGSLFTMFTKVPVRKVTLKPASSAKKGNDFYHNIADFGIINARNVIVLVALNNLPQNGGFS